MNICEVSVGHIRIPTEFMAPVEAYSVSVSKEFSQMGHNVTILDRRYSKTDPPSEYMDGIRIVRLKAKRFSFGILEKVARIARFVYRVRFTLNEISFAFKARKYLSKKLADFDVIEVYSPIVGLTLVMFNLRLGEKVYYTSPMNIMLYDPRILKPSLPERIHTILNYAFMRRVRKVIAENEVLKEKVITEGKVKPENVALICPGKDIEMFSPDIDIGDIKERYGLGGKFNILFVGKIDKVKGVEYLVRAADIIVNDFAYRNTLFLLVGPFEEGLGDIEKIVKNELLFSDYPRKMLRMIADFELEENVKLTGFVSFDDLRRLYAACDVFVLTSLAETFGHVIGEAMACSKPVVASKTGGALMQVKEGWNGFLVGLANEKELAERIKYLIDNPDEAKRMGQNGRKFVEEEFTWRKTAEKLLQVFEAG